ncbi:MAG: EAL domain-containing protein [Chloroflexi bacterium]|nr:MAG: EAL domain-containing protein [Chloroflexota bacterium]
MHRSGLRTRAPRPRADPGRDPRGQGHAVGSAPLTALRDLPVDIVKLDHSFVARMAANATDATVARAVIDLGNTLGMVTMADGIERAEQFSALRAIGCVAGQGYYFSRPLTATAVERLLAECDVGGDELRLPSFKLEKAG